MCVKAILWTACFCQKLQSRNHQLSTTTTILRSHFELIFHKWPLNNDHLSTTAIVFWSRGWSLYTGLTNSFLNFQQIIKNKKTSEKQGFIGLAPLHTYVFTKIEEIEVKERGFPNSPINHLFCRGRLVVEYIRTSLRRLNSAADSISNNLPPPPLLIHVLEDIN